MCYLMNQKLVGILIGKTNIKNMKEGYYIYNNEAIASCLILSLLQKNKEIDLARIFLLLPFFLDDRTVAALNRNKDVESSLEDFIYNNPKLFITFNKRFIELLPVTINSIGILEKCKCIFVAKVITLNNPVNEFGDLGERFSKIQKSIDVFLNLTDNYNTTKLYKILKIEL